MDPSSGSGYGVASTKLAVAPARFDRGYSAHSMRATFITTTALEKRRAARRCAKGRRAPRSEHH
jgi:hypothetical protein